MIGWRENLQDNIGFSCEQICTHPVFPAAAWRKLSTDHQGAEGLLVVGRVSLQSKWPVFVGEIDDKLW